MPIYEYRCEKCKRVSSFLVRNVSAHRPPACPKCGHPRMSRLLSRFATRRGGTSTSGGVDLPDLDNLDERDPRAMARVMRRLAADEGEDVPPEMDEFCRRLESGEDPEKIEQEMGETFGDEEGGPAGADDDTLYEA